MIQFDASSVKESERFAYWHEVICRSFCRAESRRLNDDAFEASLFRGSLGCLEISDISCDALRYERGGDDLRGAPSEDFLLSLLVEGEGWLSQQGRDALQRPGDFLVYDTARPFVYEFPQQYRMILVKIPRRTLLSRVPDVERLTSIVIGKESALGGLASNLIRNAAVLDLPGDTAAAAKVGTSIIDVMSAAMEIEIAGREPDCERQSALMKRAKDYMRAHLDDPDLDIENIASAVFVSRRTLSRLFASEGTTVIRWLWRERLEQSHRSLIEGSAAKVTEVALNCGFTSFSHFSRTFKATYGVLPHTLVRSTSRAR